MEDRKTNPGQGRLPAVSAAGGVPWSPYLQARLFNWQLVDQFTLNIVHQTILKANPDRQAFYVEYVSGVGRCALRLSSDATFTTHSGDQFPIGQPGIMIPANLYPVLPQLEWVGLSDSDGGCTINVWELVSAY